MISFNLISKRKITNEYRIYFVYGRFLMLVIVCVNRL